MVGPAGRAEVARLFAATLTVRLEQDARRFPAGLPNAGVFSPERVHVLDPCKVVALELGAAGQLLWELLQGLADGEDLGFDVPRKGQALRRCWLLLLVVVVVVLLLLVVVVLLLLLLLLLLLFRPFACVVFALSRSLR